MIISACLIVKNEELTLPYCLESMRSIADEMIVVDTGSIDRTVDIAKSYGAKIFNFEWVNDFSKARNFALEQASGQWVIFLDADEYFAGDSIQQIRQIIRTAGDNRGDAVLCLLSNYDSERKQITSSYPTIRIFRNDSKIRYEGTIHEAIQHSERKLTIVDCTKQIKIVHTGYSTDIVQQQNKSRRNLDLLFSQLKEKPDDSDLFYYISDSLMLEERYEEALEYAYKAMNSAESRLFGMYQKNYMNIMICQTKLNYSKEKIMATTYEALRRYPDFPDFHVCLAELYESGHRYEDAIEAYKEALFHIDNVLTSAGRSHLHAHIIMHKLGHLYYKTDQVQESVSHYVKALQLDKYHFETIVHLVRLMSSFEQEDRIHSFFERMYDFNKPKDLLVLTKAALMAGSYSLAVEWFRSVGEQYREPFIEEQVRLLLFVGDYIKAATLCRMNYKRDLLGLYLYALHMAQSPEETERAVSIIPEPSNLFLTTQFQTINVGENRDNEILKQVLLDYIMIFIHYNNLESLIEHIPLIEQFDAMYEVGCSLHHHGQYPLAFEMFMHYSENRDLSTERATDLLSMIGESLFEMRALEEAVRYLEEGLRITPDDYRFYRHLLAAYESLDKRMDKRALIVKAISQFPDSSYFKKVQDTI